MHVNVKLSYLVKKLVCGNLLTKLMIISFIKINLHQGRGKERHVMEKESKF